jgi:hypothetical protein
MAAWLALIPAISQLLDKIIPDPQEREKAKIELLKAERVSDLEELRLALSADQMQANIFLYLVGDHLLAGYAESHLLIISYCNQF